MVPFLMSTLADVSGKRVKQTAKLPMTMPVPAINRDHPMIQGQFTHRETIKQNVEGTPSPYPINRQEQSTEAGCCNPILSVFGKARAVSWSAGGSCPNQFN
jgi:hypothetical protein